MMARTPARRGSILMVLGTALFLLPFVATSLWQPEHQASGPTAGMAEAVYRFALLTAMMIGAALFLVGARQMSRAARRRSDIEVDDGSAQMLGHYVDGRWVCFEHRRRWCPECSALAVQERSRSEHRATADEQDGDGLTNIP